MTFKRSMIGLLGIAACCMTALAAQPACDKDNGGLTLPDGFCALVAADGLGTARHAVVAQTYCFFDYFQQKLLLNPEYGGDGRTLGR